MMECTRHREDSDSRCIAGTSASFEKMAGYPPIQGRRQHPSEPRAKADWKCQDRLHPVMIRHTLSLPVGLRRRAKGLGIGIRGGVCRAFFPHKRGVGHKTILDSG